MMQHRGQADRDTGALLPDYDHYKDPKCSTYTQTQAFRDNKARHDRMLKRLEESRQKKEVGRLRLACGWVMGQPFGVSISMSTW